MSALKSVASPVSESIPATPVLGCPPAWSKDYEISLGPDETKTIDIECGELKTAVNDSMTLFVGTVPVAPAANGVVLVNNQASPNSNLQTAQINGSGTLVLTNANGAVNLGNMGANSPNNTITVAGNVTNGTLVLNNRNLVNNRVNLLQMSVAEKMPELQTASSGITY